MQSDKLATAEWHTPEEFAESNPFEDGKFWIGRSPATGEPLGYADDRHILLVSGSRSGKGTTVILPNLCLWPGSLFAIDPKGENASIAAARRGAGSDYCEGIGQKVYVLDPFKTANVKDEYRAQFNPLDELDLGASTLLDDIGGIASAIVVVDPEAKNPFFDLSARNLLKWLILHVVTDPAFEGRRNLVTVRKLLSRGDVDAQKELEELDLEDVPPARQLLWAGMMKNEAFGGNAAGLGEQMLVMERDNPKLVGDIMQTVNRHTEFIDSLGMAPSLERSSFSLDELKTSEDGISVFLCLPRRYMAEHYRWLRMLVTLAVGSIEAVPGPPKAGHRVLFCLDEFAGLKRMEIIEDAVAQIAGAGATLFFVLQTLEQLKATYKDNWETFIANCALKIMFGVDDFFSREYISKMIGDRELVRDLHSDQTSKGTSKTHTTTSGSSETASETKGESYSANKSRTDGTSTSRSQTHQQSKTVGQNESESSGSSTSTSTGTNESTSENRSSGFTEGTSVGLTTTEGQSSGFSSSTTPGELYPTIPTRKTTGFNTGSSNSLAKSKSHNTSNSTTTGWGSSRGSSSSHTDGVTRSSSQGKSTSDTEGQSQGTTEGLSRSKTTGSSSSSNFSSGRSETRSQGESDAEGTTESHSHTTSQNLQKRRLVAPEEIGRLFDRPLSSDTPGWGLVLIGGGRPAVMYRSPYYRDEALRYLFDPHPDHGGGEKLYATRNITIPWLPPDPAGNRTTVEWIARSGSQLAAGDPLLALKAPGTEDFLDERFACKRSTHLRCDLLVAVPTLTVGEAEAIVSGGDATFVVPSPVTGTLVDERVYEVDDDNGRCKVRVRLNQRALLLEGPKETTKEPEQYHQFRKEAKVACDAYCEETRSNAFFYVSAARAQLAFLNDRSPTISEYFSFGALGFAAASFSVGHMVEDEGAARVISFVILAASISALLAWPYKRFSRRLVWFLMSYERGQELISAASQRLEEEGWPSPEFRTPGLRSAGPMTGHGRSILPTPAEHAVAAHAR